MADERTQYGGQAVVEGVMMRSPRFFAVACRKLSNGEIVTQLEPVEKHLRSVQKQPERVRRYFQHDPVRYAA